MSLSSSTGIHRLPQTNRGGNDQEQSSSSRITPFPFIQDLRAADRFSQEQRLTPSTPASFFTVARIGEKLAEERQAERQQETRNARQSNRDERSGSTEVYRFDDQNNVTHGCKEACHCMSTWAILVISLAEAIFTTLYFDEEKFDFFFVALVFGAFALLDTTVKSIAACTHTLWDDLFVSLASEGAQAYLYLYFCNFSEISLLFIPAMGGAQWILIGIAFLSNTRLSVKDSDAQELQEDKEEHDEPASQDDPFDNSNNKHVNCIKWTTNKLIGIAAPLVPLIYLLTQADSPFNTKEFEISLTVYFWLIEVTLTKYLDKVFDTKAMVQLLMGRKYIELMALHQQQLQQMQREETEQNTEDFDEEDMEQPTEPTSQQQDYASNEGKQVPDAVSRNWVVTFYMLLFFVFLTYLSVLSWMWWFSPDIRKLYDQVLTMVMMVCSVLVGLEAICFGCLRLILNRMVDSLRVTSTENDEND